MFKYTGNNIDTTNTCSARAGMEIKVINNLRNPSNGNLYRAVIVLNLILFIIKEEAQYFKALLTLKKENNVLCMIVEDDMLRLP